MILQNAARLFLCLGLILPSVNFAFETDQYNLPPAPLADIGDEVSEYAEENLRRAVHKINDQIRARQACVDETATQKSECGAPEKERARLAYLRSEAAVALELYKLLGAGFPPFTKSGGWMDTHDFRNQPARYKTGYNESIFAANPVNYFTISPTVKIYAAQFGTDKVAHFFQQGYTYYKIYRRALAKGASPDEANRRAVRWGRISERTFYGTLVSGVYSNGDLAANYAGMKFYLGLTEEIKIGDRTRPAILILQNGVWNFNEAIDLRQTFIKPFVTDHFNEALNPSVFTKILNLRDFVRRAVKRRSCDLWRKEFSDFSPSDFDKTSESLTLWFGEDYGYKRSSEPVTIASVCFTNAETRTK